VRRYALWLCGAALAALGQPQNRHGEFGGVRANILDIFATPDAMSDRNCGMVMRHKTSTMKIRPNMPLMSVKLTESSDTNHAGINPTIDMIVSEIQ
jgi:hypothetical protein